MMATPPQTQPCSDLTAYAIKNFDVGPCHFSYGFLFGCFAFPILAAFVTRWTAYVLK